MAEDQVVVTSIAEELFENQVRCMQLLGKLGEVIPCSCHNARTETDKAIGEQRALLTRAARALGKGAPPFVRLSHPLERVQALDTVSFDTAQWVFQQQQKRIVELELRLNKVRAALTYD